MVRKRKAKSNKSLPGRYVEGGALTAEMLATMKYREFKKVFNEMRRQVSVAKLRELFEH